MKAFKQRNTVIEAIALEVYLAGVCENILRTQTLD